MTRLPLVPLLLFILIPMAAQAATLRVPSEYPTIQAGIDSASVGDTVLVAEGIYVGIYDPGYDFRGKDIVLLSEKGPLYTVIYLVGSGRGFQFHGGETGSAVVEGFTIWGGRLEGDYGGGMTFENGSSPLIKSCLIAYCSALKGGGVYCDNASPSFVNCTISKNEAYEHRGGPMYCTGDSSPWLIRTVVLENGKIELDAGATATAVCCALDSEDMAQGQGQLVLVGEQVFDWCGWCGEQSTLAPPMDIWPEYFAIHDGSPCRAEASPCGELIGAFDVMCHYYPVEKVTWGRIKATQR